MAAFHQQTNADFSVGLREHIRQQLAFEEEQQKLWRQLLAVFEQIETPHSGGSHASPAPAGGASSSAGDAAGRNGKARQAAGAASALDASFAMAEMPWENTAGRNGKAPAWQGPEQ